MEQLAHSLIGGSSLKRVLACPASVRLSHGIPNLPSAAAEEGTIAHAYAEELLRGRPIGEIDDETLKAVSVYVKFVQEELRKASPWILKEDFMIEARLDLSEVHPGIFGTADCIIVNRAEDTLQVIDYKHGKSVRVEPEENEQLQFYALGALLKTGYRGAWTELIVVQPRHHHPKRGPIRRWKLPTVDVLLAFQDDLKAIALEAESENPRIQSGSHCYFCPAKFVCPLLREKVLADCSAVFSVIEEENNEPNLTLEDFL